MRRWLLLCFAALLTSATFTELRGVARAAELLLTIPNPNGASGDDFGLHVAAVGNDILVGAPCTKSNEGAAYLFRGSDGERLYTFSKPNPCSNAYFGYDVASDGSRVLIGAVWDVPGRPWPGAAYLFEGAGATWGKRAEFANPHSDDPTPNGADMFGEGLALEGDTVLVGANMEDIMATDAGAAYLFNAATGDKDAEFLPAVESGYAGRGVAIVGNCVFVGAYNDGPGKVYVFDVVSDPETQKMSLVMKPTINNPNPGTPGFGGSIAVAAGKLLIGAWDHTSVGGAYLYEFDGSTWNLDQSFPNPTGSTAALYGRSVALVGSNVVVGAPFEDAGAGASGAVYVFHQSGNRLDRFFHPSGQAGAQFGSSVAALGSDILVGAPHAGPGGTVFLFAGPGPSCPCEHFTTSDFGPPMGKKKQLGSTLPVKFQLFFDDDNDPDTPPIEVAGQEQLNQILTQNGCQPDSPRIRIYDVTEKLDVDLPEDEGNVGEGGDLGDAFRYSDGNWIFNLKLPNDLFFSGREYKVTVGLGECELTPGNNLFEIK
jgi:hypothetical protein